MNLRKSFLDNPVLIKHIRSRLRRQHLMPPLIMALVIASTICWGSLALESGRRLTGLAFLLIVQSGILFVGGSSQVGLAVAQARTAGILDFHRISPQHPFSLAVGFILGGPILEWVLFAAMTPFALVLGLVSRGEPLGLLAIYLDTVVVALLYHTISMAAGLVGRAPNRQNYLGVLFLLMVLYSFLGRWMSTAGSPGFLTTIPVVSTALSDLNREALLFGIPVPVLLHSLLHQLFLLGVALLAATRKMRQEQAPFLSKRQALGAFVGVALLAASSLIETIRQQPAPTLPESRNGGLAYFHFLLWLAATVLLL
ncbi:MAG: hypothetical protein FJX77_10565, partial [Armatimonadetes bacterium]|nr:hypothetical protein [Armatimonadota bacterium]